MKKHRLSFLCLAVFFLVLSIFFTNAACAGDKAKVLILPFAIHAEKDLAFLNPGIMGMLSSRLSSAGRVTVIKSLKAALGEQAALALAKELGADYVLIGSLTVFGNSVSTDARFLEVTTGRVLVPFNRFDPDQGAVLGHINELAGQINTGVFGGRPLQTASEPAAGPASAGSAAVAVPRPVAPASQPVTPTVQTSQTAPAKQVAAAPEPEILKSKNFKTAIRGLSIGDVTGDGKTEIVFTGDNTVFVYRLQDGQFTRVMEIKGLRYNRYLSIDVADINGNGMAEIFVTSIDHKARLNSFVLEWNGARFNRIVDQAPWYFRVVRGEKGSDILAGQKQGLSGIGNEYALDPAENLFFDQIDELQWNGRTYKSVRTLDLPGWVNLFGFTFGNAMNKGETDLVAFSNRDKLQVLNSSHEVEWESSKHYGGSLRYLEYPDPTDPKHMERYYLPQRVLVSDMDNDGKNEIIVVKNKDSAGRYFSRFRSFSNGRIECLAWTGLAFKPKWQTDDIAGYISDYAVADLNNDGHKEVIFAVGAKAGLNGVFSGRKSSYLVTWRPGQ